MPTTTFSKTSTVDSGVQDDISNHEAQSKNAEKKANQFKMQANAANKKALVTAHEDELKYGLTAQRTRQQAVDQFCFVPQVLGTESQKDPSSSLQKGLSGSKSSSYVNSTTNPVAVLLLEFMNEVSTTLESINLANSFASNEQYSKNLNVISDQVGVSNDRIEVAQKESEYASDSEKTAAMSNIMTALGGAGSGLAAAWAGRGFNTGNPESLGTDGNTMDTLTNSNVAQGLGDTDAYNALSTNPSNYFDQGVKVEAINGLGDNLTSELGKDGIKLNIENVDMLANEVNDLTAQFESQDSKLKPKDFAKKVGDLVETAINDKSRGTETFKESLQARDKVRSDLLRYSSEEISGIGGNSTKVGSEKQFPRDFGNWDKKSVIWEQEVPGDNGSSPERVVHVLMPSTNPYDVRVFSYGTRSKTLTSENFSIEGEGNNLIKQKLAIELQKPGQLSKLLGPNDGIFRVHNVEESNLTDIQRQQKNAQASFLEVINSKEFKDLAKYHQQTKLLKTSEARANSFMKAKNAVKEKNDRLRQHYGFISQTSQAFATMLNAGANMMQTSMQSVITSKNASANKLNNLLQQVNQASDTVRTSSSRSQQAADGGLEKGTSSVSGLIQQAGQALGSINRT